MNTQEHTVPAPLVIPITKGTYLAQDVLAWFQLHFPPDSDFDGLYHICYQGRGGFRILWTGNQLNIAEFLSKMKIFNKSKYYIIANSTTGLKRQKKHLFALQNMVIDIDCHDDSVAPWERDSQIEEFLTTFRKYKDLIPTPQSIIHTGRGLQIWWAIQPVHAKLLSYYDHVKKYFLHVLQKILDDNKKAFPDLTLDYVASLNPVGVYRLPGTKNPIAKRKVTIELTGVTAPYILQDLEALMKSKAEELHFNPQPQKQKTKKHYRNPLLETDPFTKDYTDQDMELLEGMNSFTFFRTRQLLQLRHLRNLPAGAETRNNYSLLFYSALRSSFDHKESWERLQKFNQQFKIPMTISELENVISTAQYKEGYQYSNKKVIDFLQVTQSEQGLVGLYAKDDDTGFACPSSHVKDKIHSKMKKAHFKEKILSLHLQGKTAEEIGAILGRDKSTIRRHLKPTTDQEKSSLLQDIKNRLGQGIPFPKITKAIPFLKNLSHSQQYRLRKEALALA